MSMVEILKADSGDFERWDQFVVLHDDSTPYHLTAWGKSISAAYGHESIYLLAERGQEVVGVFPITVFKTPWGRRGLCSLPYCDIGGSLSVDADVMQLLGERLSKIAREEKIERIEIRLRGPEVLPDSTPSAEKVSLVLTLPSSSEELFASLKAKVRSQIRKAKKNALRVRIDSEIDSLRQFYSVWSQNMRDLGSPAHSYLWFEELRREYSEKLRVAIVLLGDEPVAAGILLVAGRNAAVPWASARAEFNRLAPNMLLYWELIKQAIDLKCAHFDFGRSTINEGTYRFKKQWGAEAHALIWRTMDAAGAWHSAKSVTPGFRWIVEKGWQQLPLPVANQLGPRLRKFISL